MAPLAAARQRFEETEDGDKGRWAAEGAGGETGQDDSSAKTTGALGSRSRPPPPPFPVFHVVGNHCLSTPREDLEARLGIPSAAPAWAPGGGATVTGTVAEASGASLTDGTGLRSGSEDENPLCPHRDAPHGGDEAAAIKAGYGPGWRRVAWAPQRGRAARLCPGWTLLLLDSTNLSHPKLEPWRPGAAAELRHLVEAEAKGLVASTCGPFSGKRGSTESLGPAASLGHGASDARPVPEWRVWWDAPQHANLERRAEYNGGLGYAQLLWTAAELERCRLRGDRAVVAIHHPPAPEQCRAWHCLWDGPRLLDILESSPAFALLICGHDHGGGYHRTPAGKHYVTLEGVLESPPGTPCHFTIELGQG